MMIGILRRHSGNLLIDFGIQDDKDMWRKKKRKRNRTIDYSDLPSTLVYECSVSNLTIKISTFSNVAGERLP